MLAHRTLLSVILVALISLFVIPCDTFAQARRVNAGDQRRTERVIRDMNKLTTDGINAMNRTALAVEQLLARLAARGADSVRLDAVGNHYAKSVSAVRVRQQARINTIYNIQLNVLNSVIGGEDLVALLTGGRDGGISDLVDTENTALGSIADAVAVAGG